MLLNVVSFCSMKLFIFIWSNLSPFYDLCFFFLLLNFSQFQGYPNVMGFSNIFIVIYIGIFLY